MARLLSKLFWYLIYVIFIMAIALAVFIFIYGTPKSGKEALAVMSEEQRKLATEILPTFTPQSSVSQMSKILGEPLENGVARVKWKGPFHPDKTRIQAYYLNGKIIKITYLSIDPYWGYSLYATDGQLIPSE